MCKSLIGVMLSTLLLLSGCANSNNAKGRGESEEAGYSPATMVYAEGWTDIAMVANWAKTGLDHLGHFVTSRNACGRDEAGAISLDLWNTLAEAVNRAVIDEPAHEEYCIAFPQNERRYMDGTAELVLSNGKKILLFDSTKGNGACTRIRTRSNMETIFNALNQIVVLADKEGCNRMPY